MTRRLLCVWLLFASGCASTVMTESRPEPGAAGRATLEILPVWAHDKTQSLVGGLRCEVRRIEPGPPLRAEQITKEGQPLRMAGLRPGSYTVTVSAQEQTYTTPTFQLEAERMTTVEIDMVIARSQAEVKKSLKQVGEGLFRLVTLPLRVTAHVFGARTPSPSRPLKSGEPPFSLDEKPTPHQNR
jgi:hypothetical protein